MAKKISTKKKKSASSKKKVAMSKKSTTKKKQEDQSIEVPPEISLSGLPLIDITESQKKSWRGVREGIETPARKAFQQALDNPTVLGITNNLRDEITQSLEYLDHAEMLEPIQQMLEKALEQVSESRMYYRGMAKNTATKIVKRARLVEEESPGAASEYSDLIDFYSRPAQKAKATRKKKKEKQVEDSSDE